jgi:hypothetical protein
MHLVPIPMYFFKNIKQLNVPIPMNFFKIIKQLNVVAFVIFSFLVNSQHGIPKDLKGSHSLLFSKEKKNFERHDFNIVICTIPKAHCKFEEVGF